MSFCPSLSPDDAGDCPPLSDSKSPTSTRRALFSEARDVPLQCQTIGNNSEPPTNIKIDVDLPDSNPPINTTLQPNENIYRIAYQKINRNKRGPKKDLLSENAKTDLFLEHVTKLASLDKCMNVLGGSHRKCTCLHLLRNSSLRKPVAKWCVYFYDLPQTRQNQVLLDWYRYAKRANPTGDKKKKLYLESRELERITKLKKQRGIEYYSCCCLRNCYKLKYLVNIYDEQF